MLEVSSRPRTLLLETSRRSERVPTRVHLSAANARYLAATRDHTAHTLDLPLAG
jgi:hypothetical protein